jgi:hypothetical protein
MVLEKDGDQLALSCENKCYVGSRREGTCYEL